IPDVIVVNKADHPGADAVVREVRAALSLGPEPERPVPIVRTDALHGAGIRELAERIEEHREAIRGAGVLEQRRRRNLRAEVLGLATQRLRRRLEEAAAADPRATELLDEVAARRLDPATAALRLLEE